MSNLTVSPKTTQFLPTKSVFKSAKGEKNEGENTRLEQAKAKLEQGKKILKNNFFEPIKNFFKSALDWFKGLFGGIGKQDLSSTLKSIDKKQLVDAGATDGQATDILNAISRAQENMIPKAA